jgi:DNA-binding MarR family transcriptional regulator
MMNKENILIFNFEANKPPVFKEERGKEYIVYGTDAPYKNLYPDYLVELYNTSGKHNAIINGKTNYISGRGWKVDETIISLEDKVKLEGFINNVGNDTLFELTKKIVKDNELFGGYALEVIVNKDGKGLTINHIDFGHIRVGIEEDIYYYTDDWSSRKPTDNDDFETLSLFPFDDTAKTGTRYLVYYKSYRPNLKEYPLPNYISGVPYIAADYEVANYVLNNTKNGYSGGTIWNFHNGQPTQEAQAYIKKQIKNKHHGSNNAGEPVIIFDDGKDKGVEIISTNPNGQDDKFINLNAQIQDEIFTAHGVDASVFIKTIDTGFSNNADELRVAIEAMNSSYIEPNQRLYEKLFNDFVVLLGMPSGLKIEKIAPLKVQISETTLVSVLTTDEIRELAGYKPLDQPLVKTTETRFSSEALDYAFATLGYSDDEIEVIETFELDYNPFDFADVSYIDSQIMDIMKANPEATVKEIAEQVGETPKQVSARIRRMLLDELIESTEGTKEVTKKGEEEITELITVYKYALRGDLKARGERPEIAGTREWCIKRLDDKRSYTRQQIERMRNDFGQNAFTNRGGWWNRNGNRVPYCRHVWSARTVKVKK